MWIEAYIIGTYTSCGWKVIYYYLYVHIMWLEGHYQFRFILYSNTLLCGGMRMSSG